METKEYKTIDKSKWPRGEWDNEPDKAQWKDEETGLPCLAVRNRGGAWCGYVGLDESHPEFDKYYGDVLVTCHGGLTFGGFCQQAEDESVGICHLPSPGEPDRVYWVGFDCAHHGDFSPGYESRLQYYEEYRNFAYVKEEVRILAKQLKALCEVMKK